MGSQTAFSKAALTPVCVLMKLLMNIYGSDYLAPGLSPPVLNQLIHPTGAAESEGVSGAAPPASCRQTIIRRFIKASKWRRHAVSGSAALRFVGFC